jgi:hypothetical protein
VLDPAIADRLGSLIIVLLLVGTPLYAAWLLLMRLIIARNIRTGTMQREAGAAMLRRLNSGVLVMAVGAAIFSAPFSPFTNPNLHLVTIANALGAGVAVIVYAYILVAIKRLPQEP